jgi:hypothetical protein
MLEFDYLFVPKSDCHDHVCYVYMLHNMLHGEEIVNAPG